MTTISPSTAESVRWRSGGDGRAALLFLLPSILGVLAFVAFPVCFSLAMAFTDWDLKRHNQFLDNPIKLVGLQNFADLIDPRGPFFRYLGNTLFFMMAIPLSVAGSLGAAILLSEDPRPRSRKGVLWLVAGGGLVAGAVLLILVGMGATAMLLMLVGVFGTIFVAGGVGGSSLYRTLFYTPHFVSGVATYILWKKLYSAQTGPINTALRPALDATTALVTFLPVSLVQAGAWLLLVGMLGLLWLGLARLRRWRADGDVSLSASVPMLLLLLVPAWLALIWGGALPWASVIVPATALALAAIEHARYVFGEPEKYQAPTRGEGLGNALMAGTLLMVGQLVCLGLSAAVWNLPGMAATGGGLQPPSWLNSIGWAKPALMVMGFWAAVGSNNMLLYLAALTNVPQEMYEAADLDGARPLQRFWNITWPQLAPTTFFILVMATIGGLQGGFEMARVMTRGGPAGATTTLSYFVYIEGFATGRLGFASAVAWALFVLVFAVTLVNWIFSNRYMND